MSTRRPPVWHWGLLTLLWLGISAGAQAQPSPPKTTEAAAQIQSQPARAPSGRSLEDWLQRLKQGASAPSFVGTYVVSSASGAMSSARIWHVCEDGNQLERVDALSGQPRTTFRRNQSVTLLLPEARLMRSELRESGGSFPNLVGAQPERSVSEHYQLIEEGVERVAGLSADVLLLQPRDALRFGYRIWSEQATGLVLKTQTLHATGQVLEQAAFSELQLGLPLERVKPELDMPDTQDWQHQRLEREAVDALEQGWQMRQPLAGFQAQHCYRRHLADASSLLQWVFSDGLNTVSLFLQAYNPERHSAERQLSMGATHALSRQWPGPGGAWWVSLVGEVPGETLNLLFEQLERTD